MSGIFGSHTLSSKVEEEWGGTLDVMENPAEQRALFAALDSFYQYAKFAHYNTTHTRRQAFYALPQNHWELLAAAPFNYLDTLNDVDDAVDRNAELATAIVNSGLESFGISGTLNESEDEPAWKGTASSSDLDKARSTLRQFYRDWSSEGRAEREACLDPVIRDLQAEKLSRGGKSMNVLVPGAGLGRLVFELCKEGFNVEGNEISYHQLLASSYILNYCPSARAHIIHPWVHGFSNHLNRSQHLQQVQIPDVHPGSSLAETAPANIGAEMSMSASDFLSLYSSNDQKDIYDAIATVFFLDTAPNPIRYIQTIHNCLRQGGIWANLGPLLWHFENLPPGKHEQHDDRSMYCKSKDRNTSDAYESQSSKTSYSSLQIGIAEPGAVELTDDEIMALVEKFGFKVEKRESGLQAGYIQDAASMLQSTYNVSHWVARKI